MKKKIQIVTILCFFAFMVVLDVLTVAGRGKTYSELEKRDLAKFPKVSVSRVLNGKFQKGFVSFVSDHFAFRDLWVTMKGDVETGLGKKEISDVYICEDDYLIEKYSDADFDKEQIKENIKYVKRFVNLAASNMGTKHVKVVLVPGKETVLSDKLPKFVEQPTMQEYMRNRLKDKIDNSDEVVVDLRDVLKEHSDEYIYYRTDHHWTTEGAKYAYDYIMESFENGSDGVNAAEAESGDDGRADEGKAGSEGDYKIETVTTSFYGTAYNKVHLKVKADSIDKYVIDEAENAEVTISDSGEETKGLKMYYPDKLETADKYEYFLNGNFSEVHIDTTKDDGSTLVMIKDSYSNSLVPFFCQDYDHIYMIDLRYANSSVFDTLEKVGAFRELIIVYNEEKFMQDRHQYYLS